MADEIVPLGPWPFGVDNGHLAMQSEPARFILVHGFKHGVFTGRKISDYINPGKIDFLHARRCINGMDKAETIASLAEMYLNNREG